MQECIVYNNCNHKDCDKEFCLRKYKLDSLYNAAQVPESKRYHTVLHIDADGTDLAEFKQLAEIESHIEEFVAEGKNLYLHSSYCGNGKSSWAYRMIQTYFNKIWPSAPLECKALFISVPRFLLALKDNISNRNEYAEYITENILTADLVVWDDIAAKMASEYEMNHLLSFIDGRLTAGKSNIYTSNLSTREVYEALGERLASRICNLSIDIELHGADKRQTVQQLENKEQA